MNTVAQMLARVHYRGYRDTLIYSGSCNFCSEIFYSLGNGLKHNGFCSYECVYDSLVKDARTQDGYAIRGRKLTHRTVVEQFLGRLLDTSEHIHHLNHIRDDNRLKNLIVVSREENLKLDGTAVTKLLGVIPHEIIEQVTCEELFT